MTKTFLIAGAIAALAIPASALAEDAGPTATESASAACKVLRSAPPAGLGAETFKLTYGTNKNKSNAFGKCVSARAKTEAAIKSNASKDCDTEEAADPAAFKAKYGTGKNGSNAHGKCVSGKRKTAAKAATKNTVNAAKACKAERAADPAAFKAAYKNFGKCVSTKAKAKNDAPAPTPTPTP